MRLDLYMVGQFKLRSRKLAQDLIHAGAVSVNGLVCSKPAFEIKSSDIVTMTTNMKYVGRGGLKLEKALNVFDVDAMGKICIDVGASTGGFTDCLLQKGAAKVYSVDVGHGQLDKTIAENPRVVNCEGMNVNTFAKTNDVKSPLITVDVSFTSVKIILHSLISLCSEKADIICLFKPQFEAGKFQGKRISNKKVHISLLNSFISFASNAGLVINGLDWSPIRGGDGNIEYLFWLSNYHSENAVAFNVGNIVEKARTETSEV